MRSPAWLFLLLPGALLSQDAVAPPAIRPDGVFNAASRMPADVPAGAIARGAIFAITGVRLAGRVPGEVTVGISNGTASVQAIPFSASPERIDVVMPDSAPLGRVALTVTYHRQTSVPYRLTVAPTAFGIFTRNGDGWGPGVIRGTTRPGGAAVIEGTGLGDATQSHTIVYVAGRPATVVSTQRAQRGGGHDEVRFRVPADAPPGCFVPVQVATSAGGKQEVVSNTVTMSIAPDGRPCTSSTNWIERAAASSGKRAAIVLLRSRIQVAFNGGAFRTFLSDELSAFFRQRQPRSDALSPAQMIPPAGTCMTYSQTVKMGPVLAIVGMGGKAFGGQALDAGAVLTLQPGKGARAIQAEVVKKDPRDRQSYRAHLGGESLGGRDRALPPFLDAGEYQISGTGGAGVGPFQTSIRVPEEPQWTNEPEIAFVDRARGVRLRWTGVAQGEIVAVAAMNMDQLTGATGVTVCLPAPGATEFEIPARELSNFPPSYQMSGVPSNYVGMVTLGAGTAFSSRGLDGGFAGWASVNLKAVPFR